MSARSERVLPLLKALLGAVKSRSFYPSGHPTVVGALRELGAAYDAAVGGADRAVVGVIGRDVVVDGEPLPQDTPFVERFGRELAALGVEKLTLLRGARAEELESLVEVLAQPPERLRQQGGLAAALAGCGVRSVLVGTFAVDEREAQDEGDAWQRGRETWQQGLDGVRELSERVRGGGAVRGGEAREIAGLLIQGLRGHRGPMLAALSLRQKSPYTFSHSLNVALLMLAQVEMLGLSERQLEEVTAAGLLHDIGKLGLPDELLNKRGEPSPAEWELLRRHPVLGVEALAGMRDAGDLPLIVAFEHHRRHDGSGYPICRRPWPQSRISAIAAIADAYDAMRSNRPYDPGWSCERAWERMTELSGSAFDPVLLERFFRIVGVFPPGTLVRLSTGAIARVVRNDPARLRLPLVRVLRTASGSVPESPTHVDLALEADRAGEGALAISESLPESPGEGASAPVL